MQARFSLRYEGPAVDRGEMNVYEVATNMVAFSDFMVVAAKAAFGPQTDATAKVTGFGRGSFVTDLVFNLVGPMASVLAAVPSDHLYEVIKEAWSLWRHLRGQPPQQIIHNGPHVEVTNNNGNVITVHVASANLVFNEKGSEAVERFVSQALSRAGMDAVEVLTDLKPVARATEDEAGFFRNVAPSEQVADAEFILNLVIEAPVFKDGNKWRFSDGANSFHADILDEGFLARVNEGERFGKGDILVARVRFTQTRGVGNVLKAERAIIEVLDHRQGPEQTRLFS